MPISTMKKLSSVTMSKHVPVLPKINIFIKINNLFKQGKCVLSCKL